HGPVIALLLLFFVLLLVALDRQRAAGDRDLDILLLHARYLGRHLPGVVLLDDVHRWRAAPGEFPAHERLDVEQRATESGPPDVAAEVLEEPIDLAAQALERMPGLRRGRALGNLAGNFLAPGLDGRLRCGPDHDA